MPRGAAFPAKKTAALLAKKAELIAPKLSRDLLSKYIRFYQSS